MTDTNLVALADEVEQFARNMAYHEDGPEIDMLNRVGAALRLAAQKPGREEIAAALLASLQLRPVDGGRHGCLFKHESEQLDDICVNGHIDLLALADTILALPPSPDAATDRTMEARMTDAQIKHMVDRFLGWRLPEGFNPDGGISFKKTFNEHTVHPMKHEPSGTNLLDATQAEAMVRNMIDGLPATDRSEVERLKEDLESRMQAWLRQRKLLDAASSEIDTLKTTIAQMREALRKIADPEFWAVDFEGSDEDVNERRADRGTEAYKVARAALSSAPAPAQEKVKTGRPDGFKQYRRKQIAELRPYVEGEPLNDISISVADRDNGSPKIGDMIARNPKNHADMWLVAAAYFADNFEPCVLAPALESQQINLTSEENDLLRQALIESCPKAYDIEPAPAGQSEAGIAVTDDMVHRALNAWFASPPSETDQGLVRSMRAALEAAHPSGKVSGDAAEMRERAASLARIEDERCMSVLDLVEQIRELIRLQIPAEQRPNGLFKLAQDAVYGLRGRVVLEPAIRALPLASEARNG
jgi:hypothetical protein